MESGAKVVPGMRLFSEADDYKSGPGTYALNGGIFASLVGKLLVSEEKIVSVSRQSSNNFTPKIGGIVVGRVTQLQVSYVAIEVLVIDGVTLNESLEGRIRSEDVREFEKDSVELYKCFRPGDILRARIISLGTSRSLYLTTASNDLGVILAKSPAGFVMFPVSWKEMQCPASKSIHLRKVAKVE